MARPTFTRAGRDYRLCALFQETNTSVRSTNRHVLIFGNRSAESILPAGSGFRRKRRDRLGQSKIGPHAGTVGQRFIPSPSP